MYCVTIIILVLFPLFENKTKILTDAARLFFPLIG